MFIVNDLFAKYPLLKPILLAVLGIVASYLTGKEVVKPVESELKQQNSELRAQNRMARMALKQQRIEAEHWGLPVSATEELP